MIKTLKNTIKEIYYWIKDKVIQFKKWLVILIFGAVILAAPLLPPQLPDIALEKIQDKYETSDIKDKYRLEKTAFILDAVDENAIQAEVGNKNSDSFEPSLTLRKWSDEVNFKVKYKHGEKEKDQKVDIENKKIKWKGKKTEVHYYDIKKGELLHDKVLEADSFEVEVILLEKPDTNIVEFDIETKGLAFYYQPELTQEEIDEGAFRPENVIGSYAVYHESKQGDYSPMGLKNYRAGKAFHIYRPKIIDSAGTEVWGELNITDNLLTVEIPQEFLDNAVYPVRHAAGLTFGCDPESPGGSTESFDGKIVGYVATGAVGTATKITFRGKDYDPHVRTYKAALYKSNDSTLIANGETEERQDLIYSEQWWDFDFLTNPSIIAQDYVICIWWNNETYNAYIKYDTISNAGRYDVETYGNWPATASFTTNNNKYSIYCTYTAGGASERRMFLTE